MNTGSNDTPAHSNDELRRLIAEERESGASVAGEVALKRLRKKNAALPSPRRPRGAE